MGDHALIVIGTDGTGAQLFVSNPMGPQWGHAGYGHVPREYLDLHLREAWTQRTSPGPDVEADDVPTPFFPSAQRAPFPADVRAHQWERTEPRYTLLAETSTYRIGATRLLSVTGRGRMVRVVLRLERDSQDPLYIAWMHFRMIGPRPIVEEFFVWPRYRGRGYASKLAAAALLHLGYTGCREILRRVDVADLTAQHHAEDPPHVPAWLDAQTAGVLRRATEPAQTTTVIADLHTALGALADP
jgi:GNAT superfamily N-acetyltransferase